MFEQALTIASPSAFLAVSVFLCSSCILDTFDVAPSRSMRRSSFFALSDDASLWSCSEAFSARCKACLSPWTFQCCVQQAEIWCIGGYMRGAGLVETHSARFGPRRGGGEGVPTSRAPIVVKP